MSEKYYEELARFLAKNGIETAPLEKNTLPILLSIEGHGQICCKK